MAVSCFINLCASLSLVPFYILAYKSLSTSAKQQRPMAKFYVFWRTRTTAANFSYSVSFGIESLYYKKLALATSETKKRTEQI